MSTSSPHVTSSKENHQKLPELQKDGKAKKSSSSSSASPLPANPRDFLATKFTWMRLATAIGAAALAYTLPSILATHKSLNIRQAAAPNLDACPGYSAVDINTNRNSLTASLELIGPCNVYGPDLRRLSLQVTYETDDRIHVKIADPEGLRYQVPESVFPRPKAITQDSRRSSIEFKYTKSPFTFSIVRRKTGEVLFDTKSYPLIFEPQYLRVKTSLPANANLYGLGEHTETFRLPTKNTTRTMWARDSYGVPTGTNLYGVHPIYYEHRSSGTHAVFLLNSNGIDIKINEESSKTTLEYNVIGGILDFYFLAGPSPVDVARQYAEVAGLPAEVPYWSFGFHQCRYGYKDYVEVQQVIANYSAAGIPLETMWTDIDYMLDRLVFSNDPVYFPTDKLREIVSNLHSNNQHYIVMVDPAVGVRPGVSTAYDRGSAADIWLKEPNGTDHLGIVWPGVVVWPDWFHPQITSYWNNEFALFFNPKTGIDIDGVWIDMNEPASFCTYPCDDPYAQAKAQNLPPPRNSPPPSSSDFQDGSSVFVFQESDRKNTGEVDVLYPPYAIANALPYISDRTAHTDVVHANGLLEYDTHNLYGTMMSTATRDAMLARRPGLRPLIITRSTFAGAGAKVGKWLGDNLSEWSHYRFSIAGMLGFASLYQVPEVGSDTCGFGGNTTETLCARWASLGAFQPFFRNHNGDTSISQEFYRWPLVAESAKKAIDIRYRLLDYFYTAFHKATVDGTPVLQPLWFQYPRDARTFGIDMQFLYGERILVSPVLEENSTSVEIYLPNDLWYEFDGFKQVQGGGPVQLSNIDFTEIPIHVRGGSVIPLRSESAYTTTELRKKNFELLVTVGKEGTATGEMFLDDGVSLVQKATRSWTFDFKQKGRKGGAKLSVKEQGKFEVGNLEWTRVLFAGLEGSPKEVKVDGKRVKADQFTWNGGNQVLEVNLEGVKLRKGFEVELVE